MVFACVVKSKVRVSVYFITVQLSYLFVSSSLPGDSRTKVGFITFDSTIHFYNLQEGISQPQMLVVSDIEGIFILFKGNMTTAGKRNKYVSDV